MKCMPTNQVRSIVNELAQELCDDYARNGRFALPL